MAQKETIAILGGTGDLGTGLAIRWAKAGHRIVIGSRTLEKAQKAVANLHALSPQTPAEAMVNPDAAAAGDIVVLTVPAAHQISTLESVSAGLKGKILIDVTVPLVPPRVGTVQLPGEGSAGKRAQDFLGSRVKVVTAFQNVAAHLLKEDVQIECDVLVCGDKRAARQKVIELAEAAGMNAWHAGPIENSAAAEALTSVLIQINRRHDISHSRHQDRRPGTLIRGMAGFTVTPLPGIKLVEEGDDLPALLLDALAAAEIRRSMATSSRWRRKSSPRRKAATSTCATCRRPRMPRNSPPRPRRIRAWCSSSSTNPPPWCGTSRAS